MSFRLFIYYCALCGAGGAFAGWVVQRGFVSNEGVLGQGYRGLDLGIGIALALSLVDALWNLSLARVGGILLRVLTAVLIGGLGGLFGGLVAQMLYEVRPLSLFLILGWPFTGLLIGASLGIYDLVAVLLAGQETHGATRKVLNGVIGGSLGGFLGGTLSVLLHGAAQRVLHNKPEERLWSPSAVGFTVLGACIGLLIGLAQVILKEAWLKVEAGFRRGREQILSKPEVTIGRAESCDIGLFGDPGVDRLHARIHRRGNDYVLTDAGSGGGTFVNDQPIKEPRVLRSGDLIRLGRSLLRFGERQKNQSGS
jgi:hypothetical protein